MKAQLVFILLILFSSMAFGQGVNGNGPVPAMKHGAGNSAPTDIACYLCPDESIFSNTAELSSGAGLSDDLTCYTCFDNFHGLTGPFNHIIFWGYDIQNAGSDYYECEPSVGRTFDITIYQDLGGSVGDPVASYNVNPSRTFCIQSQSYNRASLYKYEATLPSTIGMTSGWISIRAAGGSGSCWFAWAVSESDDLWLYQSCTSMQGYELDLAWCLGLEETPPVSEIPVSSWALVIGLALIAGLTVIRLRRP